MVRIKQNTSVVDVALNLSGSITGLPAVVDQLPVGNRVGFSSGWEGNLGPALSVYGDPKYLRDGVDTSNGYFSSADDSLLFYGERSYEICFTTGSIGSSICRLFSDSLDGTCSAAWAENGNLYVKFLGSSHTLVKELSDNTFYQLIINKDHVSINGIKILTSSPGTAQPSNIAIGSYGDATHMFNGVIHRFRIFNYYLTDSDEEILWNNGNPMAGSWPMMQNIPFPGDRYTESSMTFFPNNPNVSTSFQLDVAQANGFSGKFMRFDAITTLSIYTSTHAIISPVVTNRVRYNIEYRGFGPFFYGTASNPGNTVDTALPDNTGDAKKYAMVFDATKINFVITDSNDSPDSWLEIRVNSIEVAGCVAEYTPQGLMQPLPNIWRDVADIGQTWTPDLQGMELDLDVPVYDTLGKEKAPYSTDLFALRRAINDGEGYLKTLSNLIE